LYSTYNKLFDLPASFVFAQLECISNSGYGYKDSLFLRQFFLLLLHPFFFVFQLTMEPHNKRITLYTTTLNECTVSLSFSSACPSLSYIANINIFHHYSSFLSRSSGMTTDTGSQAPGLEGLRETWGNPRNFF
jgi:hypothetical protein